MAAIPQNVNIYLIESEKLVLDSLSQSLSLIDSINVCGTSNNFKNVRHDIFKKKPDVLIVDARLINENGFDACKEIKRILPETKVIILSSYLNESLANTAYIAGASAFLSKSVAISHLIGAIFHVTISDYFYAPQIEKENFENLILNKSKHNHYALTNRELQVLNLIAKEYTTRQIADKLGISEKTVRNHKSNIMNKLGIKSDVALIKYAYYMAMI